MKTTISSKLRISLEAARVNAKLTQAQACAALGVSLPTLAKWERGNGLPPVDKAVQLASLYGLKLDNINFIRNT